MKATTGKKRRTTGKLEERGFRSHQNPSVQPLYVELGTTEEDCVNCVTQNKTVTHYNFVLVVVYSY
jgi:hypothetical protein